MRELQMIYCLCAKLPRALIFLAAMLSCAPAALWAADDLSGLPPFPANPDAEKTYPVRQEAANRGVRLTVFNAARTAAYGSLSAPAGRSLLVLNTEWENVIPLTLSGELKLATTYAVPNLADHLYLVADRKQLIRLNPENGK